MSPARRSPDRTRHAHAEPSVRSNPQTLSSPRPTPGMRWVLRRRRLGRFERPEGRFLARTRAHDPWTIVVMAAFGRERINDPRQLVGERHRGPLELVLDGLALEHSARPAAQGVVMPFAGGERGTSAHDQKLAQVAVARLGDPPKPRFAAGRMLAGSARGGGELPSAGKCGEVLDRGEKRHGGDRADPGNALSADVRCPTMSSRARWRISSAWFSTRAHGNEALSRPPRRLADRRRVGCVALVAPDRGLHVRRRDELYRKAEFQNAAPSDAQRNRPPSPRRTAEARRKTSRAFGG